MGTLDIIRYFSQCISMRFMDLLVGFMLLQTILIIKKQNSKGHWIFWFWEIRGPWTVRRYSEGFSIWIMTVDSTRYYENIIVTFYFTVLLVYCNSFNMKWLVIFVCKSSYELEEYPPLLLRWLREAVLSLLQDKANPGERDECVRSRLDQMTSRRKNQSWASI